MQKCPICNLNTYDTVFNVNKHCWSTSCGYFISNKDKRWWFQILIDSKSYWIEGSGKSKDKYITIKEHNSDIRHKFDYIDPPISKEEAEILARRYIKLLTFL